MGCDIHMHVEYKKELYKGPTIWVDGDLYRRNPYFGFNTEEEEFHRIELYGYRNYALFSTLAGVRDYTGSMVPVSEPKGLPEDCCNRIKEDFLKWEYDAHSTSFLTLAELKEYQSKNPILKRTGLLDPKTLKDFDGNGTLPESWCQGTNIPGYERREWQQENIVLLPLIDKLQKRAHELLQSDWQDYNESNDDLIRIVFWFDN